MQGCISSIGSFPFVTGHQNSAKDNGDGVMFSTTGTVVRPNTASKRPAPPPPPNAAPLAMNEGDLFHHSAASWQRSSNGDWAACHGAASAPPSYTYAYSGPAPPQRPVAFAPARVPAWQQAAETAAEKAKAVVAAGEKALEAAAAEEASATTPKPDRNGTALLRSSLLLFPVLPRLQSKEKLPALVFDSSVPSSGVCCCHRAL